MARVSHRFGPVAGLVLALICSIAPVSFGPASGPDVASAALPAWHGGIDLYRRGTFTTQKSWLWCTAADVQIIRNITRHETDHGATSQRRYFDWMRAHNRYSLPLSAGVDAAGWTAGLRHFVDGRYRLVASKTFAAALRSAVTNLRRTNLPVGITVSHGNHAWILTGFTATADPLKTATFTVTSVRVVGPLYGLQSRNGYDMPPDTKLTPAQFAHYFTPWKYAPKRMIWDGLYVSVQPIAAKAATTAPAATPRPTVKPVTPSPSAPPWSLPSAEPSGSTSPPDLAAGPSASAAGAADAGFPAPTNASPAAAIAPTTSPTGSEGAGPAIAIGILAVVLAAAVLAVGIGRSVRGPRPSRRLRQGR
jgi:hypothetical protein